MDKGSEMFTKNARLLLFSASALLALLACLAFTSHASAALAVDINFTMKDTDLSCRQWSPGQTAIWNFTLWMNGTDSSLITTPTYVWIDDSQPNGGSPAMRADSWVVILTASGNQLVNPPSYDSANSNELAIGSGVFAPGAQTLDVHLYASEHIPPAPPTNVTLQLTPSEDSENKDHNFTVTATTHRMGVPVITRKVPVCVHVPPKPRFELGNLTNVLQSAADADIQVSFWLKNVGNTQDWYFCNVSVPRDDWTWSFAQGINIGPNITNLLNINQNITIRVSVHVPANALAKENSTVSLNCTSIKASPPIYVYPPYTRIEVTQYFYIFARIVGDSSLSGIPGDQLRFNFLVQNQGNGPDHGLARIVAPSNLSWDALCSPCDFDLSPLNESGDSSPAQFLVTIPLGTVIFTYDFQINVTSGVNFTTPITQLRFHVQVKQVYVPIVSPVPVEYGAPAQEILFSFTIKNGGNGLDSLLIDVINISDWRVFLSPPIGEKLLQVGEEAAFQATVIVPKDLTKAQVGSYSQLIRISSKYASLDIGQNIFVETNLTVIIRPRVSCSIDPTETDKELNPFTFSNDVATANFILALENTGNGGDAVSVSATAPEGFNVTLSPQHLQLSILETKAVLVSIVAPPGLAVGQYSIVVTARSDVVANATCTSEYRLDIFHLDAALSPTVQSKAVNPEDPGAEVSSITTDQLTQVEGYLVTFHLTVQNQGQRAIAAGSLHFVVYDTFDCQDRVPIGATNETCGHRAIYNWTNPNNIITGVGGTIPVDYQYFAPEYLCFDVDVCHRKDPPPPSNGHHLDFVLTLANEGTVTNNNASVTVDVLPKEVIVHPPPPAPFPIAIVAVGVGAAGLVGFVFWYRFVRKPKVDEDLYASIYGGGAVGTGPSGPAAQSQTFTQYFASQDQAGAPTTPGQAPPQAMTDEQLEEARRIYGDQYGRQT
jgi:uncharacterized membrane protein